MMTQQTFNLHTHTARCGHGEGLDIQYIQSAIDAGFKMLGFSEHIPYVEMRLPNCRMFYEQKAEYVASLRRLQEIFAEQIEIKIGYEVEYMDGYQDYLRQMKQDCDYMILGQHCKFMGYEYDCFTSDEDVMTYAQQVEEALETGLITYIAHPDYYMLGRRHFSKTCEEAAWRIAKASAKHEIPLEINLNGFHYGKKTYTFYDKPNHSEARYPYPFREFWEIASTCGCQALYGYDAHTPIAFQESDRIEKANEILKGIQLNFAQTIRLR